jgi:hypothetical protein
LPIPENPHIFGHDSNRIAIESLLSPSKLLKNIYDAMNTLNKANPVNSFIVLGGHKCGTTSLHHYLGQHPDIVMPQVKGQDILNKPIMTIENYRNQYNEIKNEKLVGEVSSTYLYSKRACINIHQYFPEAKLIAIIRNPFDRAFSHFYAMTETDPLRRRCVFDDICKNPDNFLDEEVVRLGLYYSFFKMYFDRFERNQICVLLFDNLVKNKPLFFASLFKFAGVDPTFLPDTSVIMRKGGKVGIKNKSIKQLFENQLVHFVVGNLVKPFTNSDQRRLIYLKAKNIFVKRKPQSSVSNDLRKNLINFYREDIIKTQDLLGISLSHWL